MRALRVTLEGDVTSFRYPHFMWGTQPTFEMPPPATIYGHICSAVGEWLDPRSLRFAYHFTSAGKFTDLEHIHAGGAMETITTMRRREFTTRGHPEVSLYGEATVTPFTRELLFRPRLTLYIDRPDLVAAFRHPRYAVVLGRSQDLCVYPPGGIEVIELQQHDAAYYEHTLLPLAMGAQTRRGVAVMMPRYIDYHDKRRTSFAQYIMLKERVVSADVQTFGGAPTEWCDVTAPRYKHYDRAVVWHSFID